MRQPNARSTSSRKGWFYVGVFYDKLHAANHPLDFRDRLEIDSPTITPTEMLLGKVQIVFPDEKDVKDWMLLLRAHEISDQEEENKIGAKFIANELASDWGFRYTVTTNLKGLKQYVGVDEKLTTEEKQDLTSKTDRLPEVVESEPKNTGWKLRSVIGPKRRWYNSVESSETVGEFGIWKLRETG